MCKKAIVIKEKKSVLGPIADALQKTGINIFDFSELIKVKYYDYLIVFYNKLPPKIKTTAKIGWWMNDLKQPNKLPIHPTTFDKIFLCNLEYKEEYINLFKKEVYYMPQCGLDSSNTFCRNIDWDVLFIGNNSSKIYHYNRTEILETIENNFKLKIISGEKTSFDQNMLYKNTKFNLSISAPLSTVTSNRLYNILASGGFAVVSWFPGIENLFENHKHLIWFKDVEEAIELIRYYQNHEEERQEIAKTGNKLYLEKHTAKCRIDNMIDILKGKEIKFRGWLN